MATTERHNFQKWAAGFTQSDIILNDLLSQLETKLGLSVTSRTTAAQPGSPSAGECYILPASPTGAQWGSWNQHDIVIYQEGTWQRMVPITGWPAWVEDATNGVMFNGTSWIVVSKDLPLDKVDATVDPTTTDDTNAGYSVGSRWVNVTDDTAWICVDATASNAVWKRISDENEPTAFLSELISSAHTAVAFKFYSCDLGSAAFTLTLPLTPSSGDTVVFVDVSGNAATNNLTIGRNGETINGVAADYVVSNDGSWGIATYDGADWLLVEASGAGGGGGGLTPVFITGNYTASAGEEIFVLGITAVITVTLPASPANTNQVIVHGGPNASAFNVTVDGNTTDTIDGDLTFVIDQNFGTFNGAYEGTTDNEWKNNPVGFPNIVSANVLFAVWKDVNYQGVAGNKVMCGSDTGALTMDMPIAPTTGTVFSVWDGDNNAGTNNVTIDPGAENIIGVTGNALIDVDGGRFDFIFDGTDWQYAFWAPTTPQIVTGTFIPTIQDSSLSDAEGQTYTTQEGFYQKIGNLVTIQINITLSSKGTLTTTDQVYIAGLPFLPNHESGVVVSYMNNLSITASVGPITGVIGFSSTEDVIRLYQWDETTGVSWLQVQDMGATTTIVLTGQYTTDD